MVPIKGVDNGLCRPYSAEVVSHDDVHQVTCPAAQLHGPTSAFSVTSQHKSSFFKGILGASGPYLKVGGQERGKTCSTGPQTGFRTRAGCMEELQPM